MESDGPRRPTCEKEMKMRTKPELKPAIAKRRILNALPAAIVSVASAIAAPALSAAEFSEAELFFELNDTDGDLGIHASIDGDAYTKLRIIHPNERVILRVRAEGRLARQGLTQLFIESAEPTFDELAPERFFLRFPEGTYQIEAKALEGEDLEGSVVLSHVLAAPVANITINGVPSAENCDAVPLPSVSKPVVIDWDAVTTSHPTIGKTGPVEIARYQFFVERDDVKIGVDLPPTVTQFQVPAEILALGNEFKFEIIARTATGNNTAIESCFTVR
jgi:hypothetical protein